MKKNNRCLKIFHFMRNENRKKEKDYFFFLRYILYETEKIFVMKHYIFLGKNLIPI